MSDSTWTPDFGSLTSSAPTWAAKRPMRILLLGDFGAGAGRGRLDTGATLARRKPLKVEFDTLEDAMQRLKLSLTLPLGADGAPVAIELADLDAFHPDQIYANVPVFAELASLRKQLNNTATFAKAAKQVQAFAEGAGARASTLARRARRRGSAPPVGGTLDDFARLTGRPSSMVQAAGAVDDLLKRIVGPFVVPAANPNKDKLVAAVDAALSDAMRALLHHGDFQNTESLWRGVDFVLRRLETSHQLQVQLLDISAEEFAADLSSVSELADCGLYKLLVDTPSQEADGGYTYIAACYHFEATPPHAELLGRAARVAAHAGASLLTGIDTDAFADRREPPHRLVKAAFAALRELPEASYLGLLGPRFMLRHTYGKRSDPIQSFAFEEFSREAGLSGMLWGHPALLALCVLGQHGAALTIDDLPFHHYVDDDGDSMALPCTDRLVNTNVATLLRTAGINGLMAHKGQPMVRLAGLEAVNGDGLAVGTAAPKKAPSDSRFAVQSKVDAKGAQVTATFAPAQRKSGAIQADAPAPVAERDDAEAEVEEAIDDADTADADMAVTDTAPAETESADNELNDLLASLDEPAAAESDAAEAEEPPMDPELEALLKSLG